MKKKRKKKTTTKKLMDENWKLCKQAVELRDGRRCIVCGSHENLQLDHCFSRNIKLLFYELENLHFLCAKCHTLKTFKKGGHVDHLVIAIVRSRHPEWYEKALHASWQSCGFWSYVWYQEQCQIKLKEHVAELEVKNE